jgi:hypothetical protein
MSPRGAMMATYYPLACANPSEEHPATGPGPAIPTFPTFAPIALDQRNEFIQLVCGVAPYHECAHTSWYAWNAIGDVRVSQLNGNVVVWWRNGDTDRSFMTFLGNAPPDKTAGVLLNSVRSRCSAAELRLVPEEVARALCHHHFVVQEDRDHFDYLLDASCLSNYRGNRYRAKRRSVNHLKRTTQIRLEYLDLSASATIAAIADLCRRWQENKQLDGKHIVPPSVWGTDTNAMLRLTSCAMHFHLLTIGIWNEERQLIASSISEIIPSAKCAMLYFVKADTRNCPGSFELMMQETAKAVLDAGCSVINFGDDMGIPSLRVSKLRYRPIGFLKKYTVRSAAIPNGCPA